MKLPPCFVCDLIDPKNTLEPRIAESHFLVHCKNCGLHMQRDEYYSIALVLQAVRKGAAQDGYYSVITTLRKEYGKKRLVLVDEKGKSDE